MTVKEHLEFSQATKIKMAFRSLLSTETVSFLIGCHFSRANAVKQKELKMHGSGY